ncbi:phospho-sugar mutase [Pseudoleptotrichia goodfellowii]|uniref:Phosphoglucomutase/phosphomannomutase alpha/beta/alpha domain I n=1 Tax=Pseudoleptotrichia goodfellowii TaxID=157692 RepID=A0A510JDB4_9FUSO|nr:phospho-sugar mutase [Pseudoleptotrichia goodfellowii]BBM37290.1 phosphoglucomutase/phosphomannomutase alpha/beta/alpha domain I [Pseudoleptotrichia goodfellowii]
MEFMEKYEYWLNSDSVDEKDKEELRSLKDNPKEIEDRFFKDLSFGTGGIRGVRGIGTNRINKYVIRKATQGLANYMLKYNEKEAREKGIIIAHDCRIGSREYALNTARVMAANGIKAYIYSDLRSTPELSFGVRYKGCLAGIVVTASHNPPEYNGYKVYWSDGGQIVAPEVTGILEEVNKIKTLEEIKVMCEKEAREKGLIIELDGKIDDDYLSEIKKQTLKTNIPGKENFKIVYTPLHGTGGRPMKRILSDFGYSFEVVKEQIEPDGNFPTVVYANPEEVAAFKLGVKLADEIGAKLVMANDPDADRIGIAVKDDSDNWYYPNGNQMGLLLLQYLLNNKKDIPANAKVITTIVSTPMIDVVAPAKNVGVMKTLTGFKYIGEKIREFETGKLDGSYLFGFEESYGYLIGAHARDKDALVTSMVIAEMAAYYNSIGSSIYKELQKLYKEFGYYLEGIKSVTLKGKDGIEKMTALMSDLRENIKDTLIGKKIKIKRDFDSHKEYNLETGEEKEIKLPKENVLQFVLEDNTYITARPSGTEPKIKFYFSVNADCDEKVKEKLENTMEEFLKILKL